MKGCTHLYLVVVITISILAFWVIISVMGWAVAPVLIFKNLFSHNTSWIPTQRSIFPCNVAYLSVYIRYSIRHSNIANKPVHPDIFNIKCIITWCDWWVTSEKPSRTEWFSLCFRSFMERDTHHTSIDQLKQILIQLSYPC